MTETAPNPPWKSEGRDLSRMLALSDGIFAFAMTLLVLGLVLPVGFQESQVRSILWNLRDAFLAYLLSFFVIWFYWRAHHLVFRYITSHDTMLLNLNVLFLLFIAIMPFVTNLLSAADSQEITAWTYAGVQVGAGSSLLAVWLHASRHRTNIDPAVPADWVRHITLRLVVTPIVFLASMPIALISPNVSEYSWFSLFVLLSIVRKNAGAAE